MEVAADWKQNKESSHYFEIALFSMSSGLSC